MKNAKGFYTRSKNNDNARMSSDAIAVICVKCNDSEAWGTGVEWHHTSGGRLDFFCKNKEEIEKVEALKNASKSAAIKSKAAFWRIVAVDENRDRDFGFGKIEAKEGKFGWFVCSFGTPDAVFGMPSKEAADFASKI